MNVRTMFVVAVLCCWAATGQTKAGETRTWADATGVFTVEAEMVGFSDGIVYLKVASGKVINVPLKRLSANDQAVARAAGDGSGAGKGRTAAPNDLARKPVEIKNDDGMAAGKKSFPMGIASAFEAPGDGCYITQVRIHGSRYGQLPPPKEDFHITLCDTDFKPIADFPFAYSKFAHASQIPSKWVTFRVKATEVPKKFVICLDFKAERTKGVYVSHDKEGKSPVGLPNKKAGSFGGGDWMVRVSLDRLKAQAATAEKPAVEAKL